jgi:hypothetical protein
MWMAAPGRDKAPDPATLFRPDLAGIVALPISTYKGQQFFLSYKKDSVK